MTNYKYPTDNEQQKLMELVCAESVKRGQNYDNYNIQEIAYRQACADGAMRVNN